MSLQPIPRSSLSDHVVERLREEITAGRWPVGERIPAEPELMAALGVARGTLREALRALQYSGMLEIRRGDGTFVRARSELPGAIARAGSDVAHFAEARAALEPALARLAAERATPEAIERIAEALERRSRTDGEEWLDADVAVHEAVAAASGNPILFEVYTALLPQLREYVRRDAQRDGSARRDPRGHEELLDAIRRGDADAAAASARGNLERAAEGDALD
ncbi:FadR/GntR family transcriptional regulator [Microbacterium sp. 22195]|uniref:FadR/GntR family transcriptional regulator n=1 Tax=Microbacterium sp. 22195 TaxID=3453891 RepID=UPI003F87209C